MIWTAKVNAYNLNTNQVLSASCMILQGNIDLLTLLHTALQSCSVMRIGVALNYAMVIRSTGNSASNFALKCQEADLNFPLDPF